MKSFRIPHKDWLNTGIRLHKCFSPIDFRDYVYSLLHKGRVDSNVVFEEQLILEVILNRFTLDMRNDYVAVYDRTNSSDNLSEFVKAVWSLKPGV